MMAKIFPKIIIFLGDFLAPSNKIKIKKNETIVNFGVFLVYLKKQKDKVIKSVVKNCLMKLPPKTTKICYIFIGIKLI